MTAHGFQSAALGTRVDYYSYRPAAPAPYPLLIFLHGAGERGAGDSALHRVTKWGPPKLIHAGRDFPMMVLAPQLPPSRKRWPVELIDELIAEARSQFPIDSSRIYLTGLSDGGDASWAYAMARPGVVAAIVPIAGGGDTVGICAMREVAVWAFHGEHDKAEPLDHELRPVDALNACNPPPAEPARITVYRGAGHEVWSRTYDGTAGHDMYAWLLEHRR
jgi:predicted peptidase